MPRSLKKGPFVDDHLLKKVDALNDRQREEGHQDLVPPVHDHPRHGRPHHRRPRRPQARPGLRDREHGRPQARRVRPDPDVQVPRRPGEATRRVVADHGAEWHQDRRRPRARGRAPRSTRPTSARAPVPRSATSGSRPTRPVRSSTSSAASTSNEADEILQFTERDISNVDPQGAWPRRWPTPTNNDSQDPETLFVSACYADEGPTLKRWRPRARGRATRIRKRTCHITIIVSRLPEARAAPAHRARGRAAVRAGAGRRRPGRRRRARVAESKQPPRPRPPTTTITITTTSRTRPPPTP